MNSIELSFPIFGAVLYCLSVIFIKTATADRKLSPTSILVFNNVVMWIIFLPSLFTGKEVYLPLIWQPILIGIFFAMGNFATFLCAHKGDVSFMTPVMGIKILIVVFLTHIWIGANSSNSILIAAIVCSIAVFIMGYSPKKFKSGKALLTFILAMWACASYAACDVLIQKYSPNFSAMAMLCISNFVLLISSFPFIGRFVRDIKNVGGKTLLIGAVSAFLMIGESLLMFLAISGDVGASLSNILYNTRGIISVILVWFVGKKIKGLDDITAGTAFRRSLGSLMILGAIISVLF